MYTNIMKKIIASVLIALLLAVFASSYHVTGPCSPADTPAGESTSNCVAIWREYPSPSELIHNKHDSLKYFSETFVIASLVCLAPISLYNRVRMKKKAKV
ncbi:MAG: hypothetical protein JWO96_459 [Candidatus Saccharibacteria bacterium]|nr:hypothetical protein [Candidatus Saccharibacteria bacterium]